MVSQRPPLYTTYGAPPVPTLVPTMASAPAILAYPKYGAPESHPPLFTTYALQPLPTVMPIEVAPAATGDGNRPEAKKAAPPAPPMDLGQKIEKPKAPADFIEMNVQPVKPWREDSPWNGLAWKELAPTERMSFAMLDWTKEKWDTDSKEVEAWYNRSWTQLDDNQKSAALRLGFSQPTWDEAEGTRSSITCVEKTFKEEKKTAKTEEVLTVSLVPEKKAEAPSAPKWNAPVGTTYALVSPPLAPPAPVPLAAPYGVPMAYASAAPSAALTPLGTTHAFAPSATKAPAPVGTTYASALAQAKAPAPGGTTSMSAPAQPKAVFPVGTTYQSAPARNNTITFTFQPGIVGIIQDGALAKDVQEGSQAYKAGVQPGWKITAVGDKKCDSFLDATFKDAAHGTAPYTITFART